MRYPITAPTARPPRYGLVQVAEVSDQVTDRVWGAGWAFNPEVCGTSRGGVLGLDCGGGSDAMDTPQNPGTAEGDPFLIFAADECSTFGFAARDYAGRAQRALRAVESFWLARELWVGTLNLEQPSLTDTASDVLTSGMGAQAIVPAMGLVEEGLAHYLRGQPGMVHMTPQLLAHAVAAQVVYRDGALWRTAMGHVVVADAGYDGSSPTDAPAATTQWLYGTGPIAIALGTVEVLPGTYEEAKDRAQATDHTVNLVTLYAHRPATWVWDGCGHVAVEVNVPVGVIGGVS